LIALVHAKYAITGLHGSVFKSIVLVVTKIVAVIPWF
jgi:hypothetical protein